MRLETSVSARNTSVAALGANASFTGVAEDCLGFTSVICACIANQDGTLYMQQSHDGVTWNSSLTFSVSANINEVHRLILTRKYFRAVYTNGSVAQTSFYLQTLLGNAGVLSAPMNIAIQQDADATVSRIIGHELTIAQGLFTGYTVVNKFGQNPDIDSATVPEDVWIGGGVYTGFPTGAAEIVTVTSSSGSDALGGVGAEKVTIYGLDANYLLQNETISLNGTGLVDSVGTYTRVFRAVVTQSANGANTAFNVGAIRVAHKTTTANVFIAMSALTNQSQVACYTIPADCTGYLTKYSFSATKANAATLTGAMWVREFGEAPKLITIAAFANTYLTIDEPFGGIVLPAKTDIASRITFTSANSVGVTAKFDLICVKN